MNPTFSWLLKNMLSYKDICSNKIKKTEIANIIYTLLDAPLGWGYIVKGRCLSTKRWISFKIFSAKICSQSVCNYDSLGHWHSVMIKFIHYDCCNEITYNKLSYFLFLSLLLDYIYWKYQLCLFCLFPGIYEQYNGFG
jgi:hypothetical protein